MNTKMSRRRIFLEYLWARAGYALVLLFFCGVFFAVFFLYSVPVQSVLYAVVICAFVGLLISAFDFYAFYERHKACVELIEAQSRSFEALSLKNLMEKDIALFGERAVAALLDENLNLHAQIGEYRDYYTMWAHQIKTPIFAMRLLLDRPEPDKRALQGELLRIEQFSETALTHARLSSGTSDLVIRECELDGIVRQAVRKYAPVFVGKGLSLSFEESGLLVLTDEKWAAYIVSQAVSNSLKYTESGGITIKAFEGEKGIQTLLIRDSGKGIPPEDLPRIFDRGFTGNNGRTDKSATGMGLYLSRQIAKLLGHRIWAESSPGEGTDLYIEFHTR